MKKNDELDKDYQQAYWKILVVGFWMIFTGGILILLTGLSEGSQISSIISKMGVGIVVFGLMAFSFGVMNYLKVKE